MTLRPRDLLLLAPSLVLAAAMALELFAFAAWRDWGNLLVPVLSGLPIVAYLWLERRAFFASHRPPPKAG